MTVIAVLAQEERMAPKRKAASATKAGGKKIKEESEAPVKDKFTSAKEALRATGPQVKANRKPDCLCHLSDAEVRTNHFMLWGELQFIDELYLYMTYPVYHTHDYFIFLFFL